MAARQQIHLQRSFDAPCDVVFGLISEPERMSGWTLGMRLRRVADGPDPNAPNGVGSRRIATMFGLVSFEETILTYEPPYRFDYSITRGSPAKHQRGEQRLTPTADGCQLDWNISFEPRIPFTGAMIRLFVKYHFALSLRGLARQLREAAGPPRG